MPEMSHVKMRVAVICLGAMVAGCAPASQGPKSPDEIPDTPAELRFDDIEVTVSGDTAAWLSSSTPRLLVNAARDASCEQRGGALPLEGEINLSIDLPDDAKSGDVYELPSMASPGAGPGASMGIEGNVSFSFGRGMIVVDERTEERVTIRLDVSSPDGTKRARGAVSAPFCP